MINLMVIEDQKLNISQQLQAYYSNNTNRSINSLPISSGIVVKISQTAKKLIVFLSGWIRKAIDIGYTWWLRLDFALLFLALVLELVLVPN